MPRCPSPRRVRMHLTYTVSELARCLDIHPNTIREWRKAGLEAVDDSRPTLFKGAAVIAFLTDRRQSRKVRLKPGEIYCVPCRAAREPAGGVADYRHLGGTLGRLEAVCPACARMMYRHVAERQLTDVSGNLAIQFQAVDSTLADTASAPVNSDNQSRKVKL